MATISFTVDASTLTRVQDAYVGLYGYSDNVIVNGVSVPNPETRAAFVKRKIVEGVKGNVRAFEHNTSNSSFESTFVEPTVS